MRTFVFVVLLAGAVAADASLPPPKAPVAPTKKPTGTGGLTATQIVRTLSQLRPEVERCFAAYGRADLALVQLTVEPDGSVSRAHVAGALEDKPTGSCIEGAVRAARFPAFAGEARAIQFPFQPR
jgi:hypothetical protein